MAGSKSQPQLETVYVEATAVRHLAAETGSIAVLGVTYDPTQMKQDSQKSDVGGRNDEETGSIHYVEETAVRRLAADTGSIVILSSTAALGHPSKFVQETDDPSEMPVGVMEVLDSEPGKEQKKQVGNEVKDQNPELQFDYDDLHVPLPVIHAMEMNPDAPTLFKTMSLSSSMEKQGLPTRSLTTELSSVTETASTARNPLVKQKTDSLDKKEIEETLINLLKIPKITIPEFAKCKPPKSKSKYKLTDYTSSVT